MPGFNTYRRTQANDFGAAFGSSVPNRGFFSKLLRDLSSWGMQYDDLVVKNSIAVNVNEDPSQLSDPNTGMLDFFSRKATAMMSQQKSIAYLDVAYPEKQRILREYSIRDEIRDYIKTVADAAIVYRDEDKRFCNICDLGNEFEATVQPKLQEVFDSIYELYKFNDGITAWNYFKKFLIDGYLCFEIVFDDWQKNVVGFNQVDVSTIVPAIDPASGKKVWVQFPEDPTHKRVLLDSQIIYVSYSSVSDGGETSYVEPLIRPYNQLKLLEHTKIQFNLQHAMLHKQITVPTAGMPTKTAKQEIAQMIADYHDEVSWDDVMGTVTIDGRQHIPYSKEYWFPEGEHGSPKVEIIEPGGHNLNEDNMLIWFHNALKRASTIPFTRFDNDNGGGFVYASAGDVTHHDERFNNFVNRLRAMFREIIVKPVMIQMLQEYPELRYDDNFKTRISIQYNGNNKYETWARLNDWSKRAEIVGTLTQNLKKGEDEEVLHPTFLLKHVMGFSQELLDENARYFLQDKVGAAPGAGGGGGGPEGAGGGLGGGGEEGGDMGDMGDGSGDAAQGGAQADPLGGDMGDVTSGAQSQPAQAQSQPAQTQPK